MTTKFFRQYIKEIKALVKQAEKDEYDPKEIILELCEAYGFNRDNLFPYYEDPSDEYDVEVEDIDFDDIAAEEADDEEE